MIDAHQHFWRLSRGGYGWMPKDNPVLYRDYGPEDLKPLLDANGIEQTIVVQADANVAETEFLLHLASTHDWIIGVVGWVDLAGPRAVETIDQLAAHPKLVGIRPMIQDIPDPRWMLKPELGPGIAALLSHDLTFDALIRPVHLPVLSEFLDTYSDLRVVVDHMAKPDFQPASFPEWRAGMADTAEHENVYCKISGLLTEAPGDIDFAELLPFLDTVAEAFGRGRLLFGSDWPVLNLAGNYSGWMKIVKQFCGTTQNAGWRELCEVNARAAYPKIVNNFEF